MSEQKEATAEEILKQSYKKRLDLSDPDEREDLVSMMQAHTASTLQALTEEVKDLHFRTQWEGDEEIKLVEMKDVLTLINNHLDNE